ncbi:MAG: glycosyltransferase family 4 protein [bacterium]|nr:glycosyltransferase family 4 protein [bacterium]
MSNLAFINFSGKITGPSNTLYQLVLGSNIPENNIIVILPEKGEFYNRLKNDRIKVRIVKYPVLQRPRKIKEVYDFFVLGFYSIIRTISILKCEKAELVHLNTILLLYAAVASRICGTKVITHVHEQLKENLISNIYLKIIGRLSDKIIGVSSFILKSFNQLGFKFKTRVIYNGIKGFKVSLKNDATHTIGMISFLIPWKGIKVFLKAAELILQEHTGRYKFIFAGDIPNNDFTGYKDRIQNFKNGIKYNEYIEFSGFKKDIFEVLKQLDLLVVPSIYPDPAPLVILESYSCGVPVFGSDIGGIPELINNKKMLFTPGDYRELSKKIISYFDQGNDRITESQSVHEYFKNNFSSEIYIDKFKSEYKALLNEE